MFLKVCPPQPGGQTTIKNPNDLMSTVATSFPFMRIFGHSLPVFEQLAGFCIGYPAIHYRQDSDALFQLSLQNVVISDNSAQYGGGVFLRKSSLSIKDSTIGNNQASYDGGGDYTSAPLT
jgi:hypothetical protein